MTRLERMLARFKMEQKMTVAIFLVVVIPVLALASMLFYGEYETMLRDRRTYAHTSVEHALLEFSRVAEVSSVAAQAFVNNANLIDHLERISAGDEITAQERIAFYRSDIDMLERMVESNLYLDQIRVYATSDDMSEMMPILYSASRMQRLAWASEEIAGDTWYFDYRDTLFPTHVRTQKEHMMCLLTPCQGDGYERVGVLEIVMRMEVVMPSLFAATQDEWSCLVRGDALYGAGFTEDDPWSPYAGEILAFAEGMEADGIVPARIAGKHVLLSRYEAKEFGAKWIQVFSLESARNQLFSRLLFLGVPLTAALALLLLVIRLLVRFLLRRFNGMLAALETVRQNPQFSVPCEGGDEIAEMGRQINHMLDTIRTAMNDNMRREMLVKDSEIRALQNQINAHFIYNVLETIKMMAEIGEKYDIADAITALGKLLRYSMRWVSGTVTVGEEVEYIRNYLALINLRYDYDINLSLSLPEHFYAQRIPKMSLQPIVENAIVHGLEELAQDAYVYIKGLEVDGACQIEITDPGRGMTQEEIDLLRRKLAGEIGAAGSSGNGIGLKNVQDRIKMTFGEAYGVDIKSQVGLYTKVIVRIPMEKGETHADGAGG